MESERDSTGCPSCFSGARWALPLIENFTYFLGNIGDAKWFLDQGLTTLSIIFLA